MKQLVNLKPAQKFQSHRNFHFSGPRSPHKSRIKEAGKGYLGTG